MKIRFFFHFVAMKIPSFVFILYNFSVDGELNLLFVDFGQQHGLLRIGQTASGVQFHTAFSWRCCCCCCCSANESETFRRYNSLECCCLPLGLHLQRVFFLCNTIFYFMFSLYCFRPFVAHCKCMIVNKNELDSDVINF